MRTIRALVPALAVLAIAACNSDSTTSSTTSLTLADRIAIADGLQSAGAAASDSSGANAEAGLALNLAAAGIIGGSDVSNVTVTTSGAAATASTTHRAVAGQLIVTNGATTDTVSLIVVFANNTNFIYAMRLGVGSGNIPDPWFAGLFNKPNSSWVATSGSAGVTKVTEGSACSGFSYAGATCNKATFTSSLNISASTPNAYTSNQASGSATAMLGTATLNGFVIRYTKPAV